MKYLDYELYEDEKESNLIRNFNYLIKLKLIRSIIVI